MMFVDNILIPNEWNIEVMFNGNSDNPDQEQIAFDRCKFLIEETYHESLFMRIDEARFTKLNDTILCHKITLPDDAIDSTIAIATLSKFMCIAEDRLEFDGLTISSRISEGIEFHINSYMLQDIYWLLDNPVKKLTGSLPWFMRSDAGSTDLWIQGKKKHEMIRDIDEWKNYGLDWDQAKDETVAQTVNAPRPVFKKGWKPTIIDGGKK